MPYCLIANKIFMQQTRIHPQLLKQITIILLILLIGILIIWKLYYFVPGLLGAITLYICFRKMYCYLTIIKRKPKGLSSILIILGIVLLLLLPFAGITLLLIPKIKYAFNNTDAIMEQVNKFIELIKKYFPDFEISQDQIQTIVGKSTEIFTAMLNATASVLVNVIVALFIVHFLFQSGRMLEKKISKYLPLKDKNKEALWDETRNMILSNAVGIPLLIICQCIIAALGYWIFGVNQYIFWGILTGIASIIPVVGCMIIYVPITIVMLASGEIGMGLGLFAYNAIITSNIDNVLRFTILKKIGDVHPLITVFGVLLGLSIFGLMGLIFGPLLLTYFVILLKVYDREFNRPSPNLKLPSIP